MAVVEALKPEMKGHVNRENLFRTAYAGAVATSRIPLEQDDWAEAADLPTALHPAVRWGFYPKAVDPLDCDWARRGPVWRYSQRQRSDGGVDDTRRQAGRTQQPLMQ